MDKGNSTRLIMKLRIKYDVGKWIMWNNKGRILYPFMLFLASKEDVTDNLFRHELEHVYQVRRDGWWHFHIVYLWQLVWRGYRAIDYEIEARERASIPLTEIERQLKTDY